MLKTNLYNQQHVTSRNIAVKTPLSKQPKDKRYNFKHLKIKMILKA